jgi:hypothetical protein
MYWLLVTLFFLFFPPALLMWTEVESATVTYSAYAGETLALVGFLYLILSTDLISFPFVINRTAVYLATGSLLVFSFFSLKIILESIVGSHTASKTEILNGVIATLGFVARQFKGAAESTLRRLVFADLGRREDSLRAHSRDAFHYRSTDTLKRDSVNAVSNFLYGVKVDFFEFNESRYIGITTGHTVGIDSLIGVKMRAAGSSSKADALQSDQTFAICIPGYAGADLVFFLGIWRDDGIPSIRPDELRAIESFVKDLSSALAHIELRELKQTYVAR